MSGDNGVSIESFLGGLKLSEYLLDFALNGYTTVEQCYGIDEAKLQDIGITKPGHVKRIIGSIDKFKRQTSPYNQESYSAYADSLDAGDDSSLTRKSPEIGLEKEEKTNVGNSLPSETTTDGFANGDAPPLPPKKGKCNSETQIPPTAPQRRRSSQDKKETALSLPLDSISLDDGIDATEETIKPRRKAPIPPTHLPARAASISSPPDLPPRIDLGEAETGNNDMLNLGIDEANEQSRSLGRLSNNDTPLKMGGTSLLDDIEHALGRPITPPQHDRSSPEIVISQSDLEDTKASVVRRPAPKKPDRPIPAARKSRTSVSSVKEEKTSKPDPSANAIPPKDSVPSVEDAMLKTSVSTDSISGGISGDDDGSDYESDKSVSDLVDENASNDQLQQSDSQVLSMSKHGDQVKALLMRSGIMVGNQGSIRKSRLGMEGKSGFLEKRGGRRNKGGLKRRWIVFDGNDLRYFKPQDKDSRSECLQIVPVSRMEDVEIKSEGKRHLLNLKTPNRTFMFSSEDHGEICTWGLMLMEAIQLYQVCKPKMSQSDEIGGSMANPDKEGWLAKQGNNVVADWQDRYVAVKGSKLCYYRCFEDYVQELPINCLDMKLANARVDEGRLRIHIVMPKRTFSFQGTDLTSILAWFDTLKDAIEYGLGDTFVLEQLQANPANLVCADCGRNKPVWASVNLMVIVCAQCIGFHRRLGAQISRARSILMDIRIWTPSLIKLMLEIGNDRANELWEGKMPPDDKIDSEDQSGLREEFISAKYKDRRYFLWSPFYGQETELGNRLRLSVATDDVVESLRLLVSGANVYYVPNETDDPRTPYQIAEECGKEMQMELVKQFNGHLSEEERESNRPQTPDPPELSSQGFAVVSGPAPVNWDRQGLLWRRGNKNEPWKKKMFFMRDRNLYYDKGTKEQDLEAIDMRKATNLHFEPFDGTLTITFPNRVHLIKGEEIDEGEGWYTALKNKQVIGVPIEFQDCNSSKVTYVVARCIDFVDSYGLETEGVYRLSGSLATIKQLAVYFNQDARSVQLTINEYPIVHDITGIFKMYLRELPEPLMTWELYDKFTANCHETDHYTKSYRLKELINSLPDVNRCTLKCIIMHLDKVAKNFEVTKMAHDNLVTIFGPSLMSKCETTDHSVLQYEYKVVSDILNYYQWLFDLDETDLSRDLRIEEGRRKIEEAKRDMVKQTESTTISDLQVSIYIGNTDDACTVKLTSESNASKVCWYVINFKHLPLEKNWSLFEVIQDIDLERPMPGNELILPLVISWGRENRLVLKQNYVAEMTAPYQTDNLSLSGTLHIKKNEGSWKKHQFVEIKTGNIKIHGKKGASSESDNLPIHDLLLYIGIDKRKKSPCRHGFTLKTKFDVRFICAEDEATMYKWVAGILKIKYPAGIWTPLKADPSTDQQGIEINLIEKSTHWGRQSMIRRPAGASLSILRDIMGRRQSLRKIVK